MGPAARATVQHLAVVSGRCSRATTGRRRVGGASLSVLPASLRLALGNSFTHSDRFEAATRVIMPVTLSEHVLHREGCPLYYGVAGPPDRPLVVFTHGAC